MRAVASCHAIAAHASRGLGHGRGMRSVVVLLVLAGCASEGISVDDWADALRARTCRYYVQCGVLGSLEACETTNIGWFYVEPELVAAVEDGRVRWNAEAAERCAAAEASCDLTSDEHRFRCEPLTSGTLHEGETCTLGAECISQECWTEPCVGQCCVGYCVGDSEPVPGHLGEACRYSGCVEGYCNDTLCLPRVREGQPCDGTPRQCDEGLACLTTPTDGRRCGKLPSTGERCYGGCAIDGERCTSNNICEPGKLLWESCLQDRDCARLYRCGAEMQCVVEGAALGENCAVTNFRCADVDAYCNPDSKCELRPPPELPSCP